MPEMTMKSGFAWLAVMTVAGAAAAGCSLGPGTEPPRPSPEEVIIDPVIEEDPPPLPTLVAALSDSGSVESISMKESDWLRRAGRWTDDDFKELGRLFDQAWTGDEGLSVSGVDGATLHAVPEGEAKQRAIAARERNWLLAEFAARGDVAYVREFVRTHGKIPPPTWAMKVLEAKPR